MVEVEVVEVEVSISWPSRARPRVRSRILSPQSAIRSWPARGHWPGGMGAYYAKRYKKRAASYPFHP
jgi:hypothetical protein